MTNRAQRLGLLTMMALCSINVWTGSPLAALWIGSRVQGDTTGVKMSSLFTIIAVLATLSFLLVQALSKLTERYDEVTGNVRARRQTPWLRAMSGERAEDMAQSRRITPAEYVIIGSVVLAVLAFEVWFFFFSGSPIGGAGGRG